MARRRSQFRKILQRLRKESLELGGRRWVRRATALRAAGSPHGHGSWLQRHGHVRFRVELVPHSEELGGRRVYYDFWDVARLVYRRLCSRKDQPWTRAELDRLVELAGLHTAEAIAPMMQRRPGSIRNKLQELKLRADAHLIDKHRLLTTQRLAELFWFDRSRIWEWRARGCPVAQWRRGARRDVPLFDLAAVRVWLMGQKRVLTAMRPHIRELMRLTPDDIAAHQATRREAA